VPFLLKLSDALRPLATAAEIKATAVRLLGEHLGASRAYYGEVDGDAVTFEDDYSPGLPPLRASLALKPSPSWTVDAYSRGESVRVDDVNTHPSYGGFDLSAYIQTGVRSFMGVPLVKGGVWRAVLRVADSKPRTWSAAELRLVEEVAARTWEAVARARAEAASRESELRYRTLFDAIDEGFCVIEFFDGPHGPLSDYVHVEANPAYTTHAGIPNVVGQKVREMVPDEADGWVKLYRDVLMTGKPIRFERELVATGRHLELAAFRVEPAERKQVAVLFQDITPRKRAEAELQRLNLELSERVARAVADREAAMQQVHEMQKMETIGRLTGSVAHDFNNLLTPIVGALDMVMRRFGDDGRTRKLTGAALQAADKATTLIRRLLAFSRRQHLQARPVDVAKVVSGMKDLIKRSIGPQIRLSIDCAAPLMPAHVDPNQFELAILNLAVNARDAMPRGGDLKIVVRQETVCGHVKIADGEYIKVAVADTGIGMDADTLRRAVEPFFTTKESGRGTGLGLPSVHGLAAQSGGDFVLDSTPEHGTTATLWLPVSHEAISADDKAAAYERALPPGAAARVLLVDDEDLVRSGTAEMLVDAGYTVKEAASPRQALDLVTSGLEIDVLVTDHAMPGMTGVDLAREIRVLRPDLPVLMITGFASMSANDAGGLPRLDKPFRQVDLARAMMSVLEKQVLEK
jgi:signal transduction histidine kinase